MYASFFFAYIEPQKTTFFKKIKSGRHPASNIVFKTIPDELRNGRFNRK